MNMTKRVTAALMAALVIMITTYNAYTVQVNAASIVIGGVTISLGEFLVGVVATGLAAYVGCEVVTMDDYTKDEIFQAIEDFVSTPEGYDALIALQVKGSDGKILSVGDGFGADHMVGGGGSSSGGGKDPKQILGWTVTALVSCAALYEFVSVICERMTDPANGSSIGAAINEATNHDVYFINPILPDNFYIGFNNDVIPGITAMDGFDKSLSHIQYYSIDQQSYVATQVDIGQIDLGYLIRYNTLNIADRYNNNFTVYSGKMQYRIHNAGGIDMYGCSYPAYYFTTDESIVYKDGKQEEVHVTSSYPMYVSPTNDQVVCYQTGKLMYLIYPSGAVWDGTTFSQPSGVSTAEGALTSVKPIVDMDLASFVKVIGKAITDAHPYEAPVLSQEAINQIYNNVSNVYDNAVTNYYSNPSYIDQSQYITNITNVYEQAIADNPAVDIPAIPSVGLGSINDYKAVGLSNVFPFCIPFDMYHLISVLETEPKAISFDYTFNFGKYFDEYTYTVDLSIFDPVMKVFRTTELILYMLGLMLITRSLIRG